MSTAIGLGLKTAGQNHRGIVIPFAGHVNHSSPQTSSPGFDFTLNPHCHPAIFFILMKLNLNIKKIITNNNELKIGLN